MRSLTHYSKDFCAVLLTSAVSSSKLACRAPTKHVQRSIPIIIFTHSSTNILNNLFETSLSISRPNPPSLVHPLTPLASSFLPLSNSNALDFLLKHSHYLLQRYKISNASSVTLRRPPQLTRPVQSLHG